RTKEPAPLGISLGGPVLNDKLYRLLLCKTYHRRAGRLLMHRNIHHLLIIIMIVISMNLTSKPVTANELSNNCNLEQIQKSDKNIMDLVCDEQLGNFYLKYSPVRRRIWVQNTKLGLKLELDHFDRNANPELVGSDEHIKFVTPRVIRLGGKKFIGAVFAHRS